MSDSETEIHPDPVPDSSAPTPAVVKEPPALSLLQVLKLPGVILVRHVYTQTLIYVFTFKSSEI